MSNWRNDRNLGPWDFTIQPNKFGFVNNPRWTDEPASETEHKPDGYWYRFKVNQYVHNLIERITLPAGAIILDVQASKSCEILYVLYTKSPYKTIWAKYSATYGISFETKKIVDNVLAQYSVFGSRISDDGQCIFITAREISTNRSILLKSTDYFWSFQEVMFNPWYGVNPTIGTAMLTYSGNGKVITLDFYDHNIQYYSFDNGITWHFITFDSYHHLRFYFTQADKTGQYVLGLVYLGAGLGMDTYYSNNYGLSWTSSSLHLPYDGDSRSPGLAVSGNGKYMIVGVHISLPDMGYIRFGLYLSSNYGASFTLLDILPYMITYQALPHVAIGMSDSGKVIAVICQGFKSLVDPPIEEDDVISIQCIYVSRDYGKTWSYSSFFDMFNIGLFETPTSYIRALKISNDGKIMYCSDYPGQRLFFSFDSGRSWAGYGTSTTTEINTGDPFIKPVWTNP